MPQVTPGIRRGGLRGRSSVSSRFATLGIAATLVVTPMLAIAPAAYGAEVTSESVSSEPAPENTPIVELDAVEDDAAAPTESEAIVEDVVVEDTAEAPASDDAAVEAPAAVVEEAPVADVAPEAFAARVAAPFVITAPGVGTTVDSVTPTFTGTGTTGNTIVITYSGNGLQTYEAGRTTVDEAGNWAAATSFTELVQGATDTRTFTRQFTPEGTEVGSRLATAFTFPSSPATAAPLTVATPESGSVSNETLNLVRFTGTGSVGRTVTISYTNASGTRSVAGAGEVDGSGNYSILTNFGQLAGGQTAVTATLRQTNTQGAAVGTPFQVDRAFTFAVAPVAQFPFTITTPQNGATVDSVTPLYEGTGTPGNTVEIIYGGQGLLNYFAATVDIEEDGTWSTTTDFSRLNGGDTEVRTRSTEYTPEGVEVPNASLFTNITFPTPPVAVTPFTVDTPLEGETRSDFLNLVRYEGQGGAGNTITIVYFGANGLATAGTGTVEPDGTYSILTNFGQLTPGSTLAQSFVQQTTPEGTIAAPAISRSFNFAVAPVAEFPFTISYPGTGETVDTVTPTYLGTGTPGSTVRVMYTGVGLGSYVAGEAIVGENGDFAIPTSFENLFPGDTEVRTLTFQYDAEGNEVADRLATLFNFPTAPVPFPLEAPVLNAPVVEDSTVTFSGTGIAGATVEIQVADAPVAPADDEISLLAIEAPVTLTATVGDDGTFTAAAELVNGDYVASATQFTGTGADRSAPSNDVAFTVAAVVPPVVDPPVTTPPVAAPTTPAGQTPTGLAYTGAETAPMLAIAALLLITGAGVVLLRRHRVGAAADNS